MSKLLIKNGMILRGRKLEIEEDVDILAENNTIKLIKKNIECEDAKIVDATNMLVIPGLVNAHLHSDENLFKGMFDNLPLEVWILYTAPTAFYGPFSDELLYLRTMAGAVEMLKKGVTLVQDDVSFYPEEPSGIDAVMQAYKDAGMRANVTINAGDKAWEEKIPYVKQMLPKSLRNDIPSAASSQRLIEMQKYMVKRWHEPGGMLNVSISLSAPQRCSDDFYISGVSLAEEYDLPVCTHVHETKVQAVTGPLFYGKSIVEYMQDMKVLSDRMSIIHAVWMNDEDIRIMAEAGVSVIHNPVSNLKLGSGIMPYLKLRRAGLNVALGTDGMSSNDSQSMFEQMKTMALVQKITCEDYKQWPCAKEILECATFSGAKSARREGYTGYIETGMRADMVVLNVKTAAFTPLNDIFNHLIYSENGSSVEHVVVNGQIVMENKKLKTVDENYIIKRLKMHMESFIDKYERACTFAGKLRPYVEEVYRMCAPMNIGMNRWIDEESR